MAEGRPRARAPGGAPGPPVGHRPRPRPALGVDVRTVRRDVTALRDLGIPVEGERGRGGSYRLKPGYRVPPLMFTSGEAASVALGLMAARRLGIDTESALAKVRRVLPDRTRLGVEALEHTLGFTGELDAAPPDPEALLAISEAVRRRPPRPRPLHRLRGRRVRPRPQPLRPRGPQRPLVRPGLRPPARGPPRPARRPLRPIELAGRAEPAAEALRRRRVRLPRPRPRPLDARGRGRPAHHPGDRPAPLPPTLAELEPHPDGTLLRLRADSLDWAAGLLAAAGCDFTVHHPDALRAALRRLANRLTAT